jgi:hypothetical protein
MESLLSKKPLQKAEQDWMKTFNEIQKQNREEGHTKCGTSECCGKCTTAKLLKDKENETTTDDTTGNL